MIIEAVLKMMFAGFDAMMSHFPSTIATVALTLGMLLEPLEYACYYFGADNLAYALGTIIYWAGIQIAWAIVEWCYKKIPGVS